MFKLYFTNFKIFLTKNLNKLNPQKKLSFSFYFSLFFGWTIVTSIFILDDLHFFDFISDERMWGSDRRFKFGVIRFFTPAIPSIISFLLIRFYYKSDFKWKDYNITALFISFFSVLPVIVFNYGYTLDYLSFILTSSLIFIIVGIFFEKTSFIKKLKNLFSVILFVWAIYKLITSFSSSKEEEVGFDTDGDGKIDTTFVDTDGDGIAETIAQDTDGDGIIDTVSSDTDGDGLIDTVVADTDGDGLTDTVIKDIDVDGDGNSDYRVTKRKGKGLT